MLCSRCKKRVAVVFVTRMDGDKSVNEGYCLTCAKELGIKPVDEYLQNMGISSEDLENMDNQLMEMSGIREDGVDDGKSLFQLLSERRNEQEQNNPPKSGASRVKEKEEKRPKRKFLTDFCDDLTAKARDGKLDRVIGRDKEIERVTQILSRRSKNNPCLIGEPGVGKTAIAEGIALRIAEGKVPAKLLDKEVFLLDLTALTAGTQFRGQFESRVKGLIDEIKAAGNIILFIDEAHTLVDAGAAEGSMNAGNMLKPALSRGEIQVIGATTFAEYRKYIEKDAALERRFQPVIVNEPSIADTLEILRGVKGYYENFPHLTVPDSLLRQMVTLSERYITDRFLPDKAIDLLDEACACAALRNASLTEYDQIQKRLTALHAEEDALSSPENGKEPDYEKLSSVRTETLRLEARRDELEPQAKNAEVTEADVAHVIELWTGIPASKVQSNELKRLASLEETLKKRIIGQDEAIEKVAAAVRRSRVQLTARRRPASFLFVGPTAVGKTELVKVLARELFDDADPLIRLDMSEFMEKFAVSRIVGSPPGYVGYDEAGQLTEKVRRKPYSVILFDEIEKAHPDVMNILLQILDEGRITDSHGRVVNFENTVIVMTSNAGSDQRASLGFQKSEEQLSEEKAMTALRQFLRPEFISRIDEIVVFKPLSEESYAKIADIMLHELADPLRERGLVLDWDEDVLRSIAKRSHGGRNGARDIRHLIRREVEDPLTNLLVARCDTPPTAVRLDAGDGSGKLSLLTLD